MTAAPRSRTAGRGVGGVRASHVRRLRRHRRRCGRARSCRLLPDDSPRGQAHRRRGRPVEAERRLPRQLRRAAPARAGMLERMDAAALDELLRSDRVAVRAIDGDRAIARRSRDAMVAHVARLRRVEVEYVSYPSRATANGHDYVRDPMRHDARADADARCETIVFRDYAWKRRATPSSRHARDRVQYQRRYVRFLQTFVDLIMGPTMRAHLEDTSAKLGAMARDAGAAQTVLWDVYLRAARTHANGARDVDLPPMDERADVTLPCDALTIDECVRRQREVYDELAASCLGCATTAADAHVLIELCNLLGRCACDDYALLDDALAGAFDYDGVALHVPMTFAVTADDSAVRDASMERGAGWRRTWTRRCATRRTRRSVPRPTTPRRQGRRRDAARRARADLCGGGGRLPVARRRHALGVWPRRDHVRAHDARRLLQLLHAVRAARPVREADAGRSAHALGVCRERAWPLCARAETRCAHGARRPRQERLRLLRPRAVRRGAARASSSSLRTATAARRRRSRRRATTARRRPSSWRATTARSRRIRGVRGAGRACLTRSSRRRAAACVARSRAVGRVRRRQDRARSAASSRACGSTRAAVSSARAATSSRRRLCTDPSGFVSRVCVVPPHEMA